jgi:uncharacterized protein
VPAAAERVLIEGAAGKIEVAYTIPEGPNAIAVIAHPHPLFGGTMDNKVVTTLARAFSESGAATFRFNFRGVGASGAVATRASGRVDFAQLVLVAPGFRRITGHGMGEAPDPGDPNLGAPGRHGPANTVIVHGDLDETVPLSDSIAWATPREVPVIVIPGGEHFFHRKLHVLREVVARWLR